MLALLTVLQAHALGWQAHFNCCSHPEINFAGWPLTMPQGSLRLLKFASWHVQFSCFCKTSRLAFHLQQLFFTALDFKAGIEFRLTAPSCICVLIPKRKSAAAPFSSVTNISSPCASSHMASIQQGQVGDTAECIRNRDGLVSSSNMPWSFQHPILQRARISR